MVTETIIANLVKSVGAIGSGTVGVVDAFQAINQKPDIWETLQNIFTQLEGILEQAFGVIDQVVQFFSKFIGG